MDSPLTKTHSVDSCQKNRKMTEFSTFSAQPVQTDFTNVPLDSEVSSTKRKKEPRRILHFSDGILEEYSTDEEEDQPPPQPVVDPRTLTWGPWTWHYIKTAAWKTLSVADTCGENLAWFFGITTPKYQSAIDEFYRLKAEEEKEKAQEEKYREEMIGLSSVDVTQIEDKQFSKESEKLEKF